MSKLTPYEAGQSCFHAGTPYTGAPYKFGTKERRQWETGWCDAQQEHETANPVHPVDALKELLEERVPAHQRVDDWDEAFARIRAFVDGEAAR